MAHFFSYAFDTWHQDGTLYICRNGDLWQRIPSPEDDDSRWSYYGPVLEVEPTQLSPRYRDALARCQDVYRDSQRENYTRERQQEYAASRF